LTILRNKKLRQINNLTGVNRKSFINRVGKIKYYFRMKKLVVVIGTVLVAAIVTVMFTFCTKQTETETINHGKSSIKGQKATSSEITLPSGECVILEIVCTRREDGTCVIDGNIYLVECGKGKEGMIDKGTYHIENSGSGWSWGCGMSCFPHDLGISLDDLLGLVNKDEFPVNCCGAGGNGTYPCDPVRFYGHLETGECVVWALQCCDGKISGEYYITDCEAGVPKYTGVFCAEYRGDPTNPGEYNNPDNWEWCGDEDRPDDIIEIIRNSYLVPCI
jgi:hypothetical protein